MKQHEQLRKYNRWRRGDKRLKQPDPKKLGELIGCVADRLEVLEREQQALKEPTVPRPAVPGNYFYT